MDKNATGTNATETIGYPNVKKTSQVVGNEEPDVEVYDEGGFSWGSMLVALLVLIAIGVGIWYACKSYLDREVEIVRLESQIKYNCLPRIPTQ